MEAVLNHVFYLFYILYSMYIGYLMGVDNTKSFCIKLTIKLRLKIHKSKKWLSVRICDQAIKI